MAAPAREASDAGQRSPSGRQRAAQAAATAATGTAVGVTDVGAATGAVAVEPAKTDVKAAATAAIVAAIVVFLTAKRQRDEAWLRAELPKYAAKLGESTPGAVAGADDIGSVVADELQREQAFAEAAVKRVSDGMRKATEIPQSGPRQAAIQGVLAREKQYARQHSEAMAARAFAGVSRAVVRHDSPQGAFWKLDPTVKEHTFGCGQVMGERFWPWVVLDRVHPPRHSNCPCRLLTYGEAIAGGHMKPSDVQDVTGALRAASGIVMETVVVDGLVRELELRDLLVEKGLTTPEALAAIPVSGVR